MKSKQSKTGKRSSRRLHGVVGRHERALILAIETLGLYAAPQSYHAIAFLADRPSGWFADDMSFIPQYGRKMPGREARKTICKIRRLLSPNGRADLPPR